MASYQRALRSTRSLDDLAHDLSGELARKIVIAADRLLSQPGRFAGDSSKAQAVFSWALTSFGGGLAEEYPELASEVVSRRLHIGTL
jgi:hypothetical protein